MLMNAVGGAPASIKQPAGGERVSKCPYTAHFGWPQPYPEHPRARKGNPGRLPFLG